MNEAQNEVNSLFDWVTARATCTVQKVFHDLAFEVEQDIQIRNSQIPQAKKDSLDFIGFKLERKNERVFMVHRDGEGIHTILRFECNDASIWVTNAKGEKTLEAKLALNDEGACMLVVGKDELAHWQFRRRALQDLFFEIH